MAVTCLRMGVPRESVLRGSGTHASFRVGVPGPSPHATGWGSAYSARIAPADTAPRATRLPLATASESLYVVQTGVGSRVMEPVRDPESLRLLHQTLLGEALMTAFDLANRAVVVSDDDGAILAVNDSWMRLLGYAREDLPTLSAYALSADPEPAHIDDVYGHLLRGDRLTDTAHLKRKDGSKGRIRYCAFPATIATLSVVVTITDDISTFQRIKPEPDSGH